MQRVVTQGQRVATRITGNAALQATSGATSQQHAQGHPESSAAVSATHLTTDEDVDDWDFVHDPVTSSEVAEALNDLSTVTGLSASQHTIGRARSEGNWSSSDSTDTANINDLFAAAEYRNYHTAREQINDIVANVLNDPVAGPAICSALARDHAFRDMVDRYAPGTALPAPAQVLNLPAPIGWPMPRQEDSNPLDAALRKIVTAVVNAVCQLGNSVRRLPEDINILLSGIISRLNGEGDVGVPIVGGRVDTFLEQEDFNRRWEAAFKRVLTTVAVAVIARRVVFKSFA